MILAIDFDGPICDPTNLKVGFKMGEPMKGAIESIKKLKAEGDEIIVFTARDRFQPVEDWLKHFKIPFDCVTNIKPPHAEVFIDDRAIRFTSWEQVMEYL